MFLIGTPMGLLAPFIDSLFPELALLPGKQAIPQVTVRQKVVLPEPSHRLLKDTPKVPFPELFLLSSEWFSGGHC